MRGPAETGEPRDPGVDAPDIGEETVEDEEEYEGGDGRNEYGDARCSGVRGRDRRVRVGDEADDGCEEVEAKGP